MAFYSQNGPILRYSKAFRSSLGDYFYTRRDHSQKFDFNGFLLYPVIEERKYDSGETYYYYFLQVDFSDPTKKLSAEEGFEKILQ